MARRKGDDEAFAVSPRARRIGGWLVAIALLLGIAAAVRFFGGNGDGAALLATPSPSTAAGELPIAFGTAIDPATGEVAADSRTGRFAEADAFAYSVRTKEVPASVYVEVERAEDGAEVVQEPTDAQTLAADAPAIAFEVPARNLLEAFGPGRYVMRIYLAPGRKDLVASGDFELVAPPTAS